MNTSQKYRLTERLMLKEAGQELLAFSPGSLEVHELNASAAAVVRMCNGENSCEEIVLEFATRFKLSIEDAAREAYRALAMLHNKNLIRSV